MNRKVKYLIVGQGIAGTLLSWQFQKRNIEHLVVASGQKKSASLIAAGMFNPIVFKRISKSWKADELMPVMFDSYRELGTELGVKIIHELPIAKLIREEEKEWWNERVKSQQLTEYFGGFNKKIPGINEEFDFVKVNSSGFVDLKQLIHLYHEKLLLQGNYMNAVLFSKDIRIFPDGIVWKNIEAESIIFCDGVHNIENSFFPEVKFYPTRGDILEVKIDGLTEQYIINKDVFLLPRGNKMYLLGSTYDHKNLEWEPNENSGEYLLQRALQIVDKPISVLNHIAGVRPTVKDRRPVLGFSAQSKRVAMFNGLGTKGVMLGPWFSEEMFKLLEIPGYKVEKEVSIERFF